MHLASLSNNKENNFNAIRLLAAVLVIYSHHFALYYGAGIHLDPLAMISNSKLSFGALAVNIFFVISGFLIAASFLNNSLLRFIFMIFLTIICFYFLFSHENFMAYINRNDVLSYLKNIFILLGLNVVIDGVFTNNVYPSTINGSLWTLPWELRMYILLTIVALFSTYRRIVILLIAILSPIVYIVNDIINITENLSIILALRMTSFFFIGAAFYFFKDKIYISNKISGLLLLFIFFTIITESADLIFVLNVVAVPYLIFYFAYKIPQIKFLNGKNDYSYGLYIYAFPIQQFIIMINYKNNLVSNSHFYFSLILSTVLIFIFAYLSWHMVEKKFLSFKKVVS